MHTRILLGLLGCSLVVVLIAGCGGGTEVGPPVGQTHVILPARGCITLEPKEVLPDDLRWRDIPGVLYASLFRDTFDYSNTSESYATVDWDDSSTTLSGTLTAVKLKPNFAYQMKLGGTAPITTAAEPPLPQGSDPADWASWASWQLGHNGRWWCEELNWNIEDSDLQKCLAAGYHVSGYLLFDFFITDSNGNATKSFALDSTYHVLWRTDQRRPRKKLDSKAVRHAITRSSSWGYDFDEKAGVVSVFAEGESPGTRPKPGDVRLPDGIYPVNFNLTEESFHDNLNNTVEYGGFWAQVLESPITFIVGTGGSTPGDTGCIAGTVTYSGRPARRVTVELKDASGSVLQTTQTKGNGKYSFENVPVGEGYTVSATDGSYSAKKIGVVVGADATTTVDLVLQ